MRSRILLTGLVIAFGLASWWLLSNKPEVPPSKEVANALDESQAPPTRTTPNPTAAPPIKPPLSDSFAARQQAFIAAFKSPISFYGKVIDQHGAPVAGAHVALSANDKPMGQPNSEYVRTADDQGRFSIENIVGITLAVAVSKSGYKGIPQNNSRLVTSSGVFEYGLESIKGPHQPNKDAPVIFRLHKVGVVEALVKIGEKSFRMARDGTPLTIAVDQQGFHQVILRCWNQDLTRPAGQRQYDWKLEVSVPNGGLLMRKDAFAFEAPQGIYMPTDIVDMAASLPYQKWDSFAERSYFIRFGDGSFARANLRMRAAGDHFVVWESFYNPKAGSPNLESPANSSSQTN
jgi:Carboxypeptidase regulatory-like domain